LVGLIVIVPFRIASAFALAMLAGLLLTDARSLRGGRQVGLVLLALSFETVWMSPFLAPVHVLVGTLDARISAGLLSILGNTVSSHENVVENASANFGIVIWPYCASSLPLAGVSLAFLTIILYSFKPFRVSYLFWLGMSFLGSILLTEIRLALLATSEASYHWWHDGPGVSIYALAALALASLFPILAALGASEEPNETTNRRAA
jgi:hypothetical protein